MRPARKWPTLTHSVRPIRARRTSGWWTCPNSTARGWVRRTCSRMARDPTSNGGRRRRSRARAKPADVRRGRPPRRAPSTLAANVLVDLHGAHRRGSPRPRRNRSNRRCRRSGCRHGVPGRRCLTTAREVDVAVRQYAGSASPQHLGVLRVDEARRRCRGRPRASTSSHQPAASSALGEAVRGAQLDESGCARRRKGREDPWCSPRSRGQHRSPRQIRSQRAPTARASVRSWTPLTTWMRTADPRARGVRRLPASAAEEAQHREGEQGDHDATAPEADHLPPGT